MRVGLLPAKQPDLNNSTRPAPDPKLDRFNPTRCAAYLGPNKEVKDLFLRLNIFRNLARILISLKEFSLILIFFYLNYFKLSKIANNFKGFLKILSKIFKGKLNSLK